MPQYPAYCVNRDHTQILFDAQKVAGKRFQEKKFQEKCFPFYGFRHVNNIQNKNMKSEQNGWARTGFIAYSNQFSEIEHTSRIYRPSCLFLQNWHMGEWKGGEDNHARDGIGDKSMWLFLVFLGYYFGMPLLISFLEFGSVLLVKHQKIVLLIKTQYSPSPGGDSVFKIVRSSKLGSHKLVTVNCFPSWLCSWRT